MPDRGSNAYLYGFTGMLKDDNLKGNGNSYDFGARIYDSRLGRWLSRDPLFKLYPGVSPFVFCINSPIRTLDVDGRLIIFCSGFLLGNGTWNNPGKEKMLTGKNLEKFKEDKYWGNIDDEFISRIQQGPFANPNTDVVYFNGENSQTSQAGDREAEGREAAQALHNDIISGKVKYTKGEAIQIIAHSHGAAYAAGMADELVRLGYPIDVVYYLAPHQPTHITCHPPSVRGVQYSHPRDAVSSAPPDWLNVGGTEYGKIPSERIEFMEYDDPSWDTKLVNGDRGGHNVSLHAYIFSLYVYGNGSVYRANPGEVLPPDNIDCLPPGTSPEPVTEGPESLQNEPIVVLK
jgi:RHS repeat-associated protein